jgi:hypothetical protein
MAERYTRWGETRKDLRDFQAAIRYCENTYDEDAPKQDLIHRKYKAYFNSIIGSMWILIESYKKKCNEAFKTTKEHEQNLDSAQKAKSSAEEEYNDLLSEGNMIKAVGIKETIKDLERQLNRLLHMSQNNFAQRALEEDFYTVRDKCRTLKNKAEVVILILQDSNYMDSDIRKQLIAGLPEKLDSIQMTLELMEPEKLEFFKNKPKQHTQNPEKISGTNTAINEPKIPVSETSET